jgi:hypothetical protein
MQFFRFVKANRDGTYTVRFPAHVTELIAELGHQLDTMLDSDGPALRRLFPTAYPDDPDRDAGYQILSRSELLDQRRANLARLFATTGTERLSEDDLTAWMHVVNDLRLVLGTVLDVSEDEVVIDEDDPRASSFEVYSVLGVVLDEIVRALAGSLES